MTNETRHMQAESGETTNRECSVTRALGTREGDRADVSGLGGRRDLRRDLRRTREALGGVRAVSGEPPKRKMAGRPNTKEQRAPGVAVAFRQRESGHEIGLWRSRSRPGAPAPRPRSSQITSQMTDLRSVDLRSVITLTPLCLKSRYK